MESTPLQNLTHSQLLKHIAFFCEKTGSPQSELSGLTDDILRHVLVSVALRAGYNAYKLTDTGDQAKCLIDHAEDCGVCVDGFFYPCV